MSGHLMNYDFGPKRHWRRWVWNRIAERVQSPRDALVVYMPGPQDNDRALATSKGFQSLNLIGVERHEATRDDLRSGGVLTVASDFFDAVDVIARKRAVSVVFADLCCGLSYRHIAWLECAFANQGLRNATFVFNLLRGRDPSVNRMRELFAAEGDTDKHRGLMLAKGILCRLSANGLTEHDQIIADRRWNYICRQMAIACTSYRSTANQTFDTVVFSNPLRELADTNLHEVLESNGYFGKRQKATRAAAAVMAIRTMRQQGTHPSVRAQP